MKKSQHKINTISILPMNQTVVFYSPIEGKNILVRTGTIANNDSFYHSLLHGYSKEYIAMNRENREKFIETLKVSLSNKMTKGRWVELSNSLTAKLSFQENIVSILSDFYKFLKYQNKTKQVCQVIKKCIRKNKEDKDKKMFLLISEAVPLEYFEKYILSSAFDKCANLLISKCKDIIIHKSIKYFSNILRKMQKTHNLSLKQTKYYILHFTNLINSVVDQAEELSYDEYIKNISNTPVTVDEYTTKIISQRFKRNIYFINSKSRIPYKISEKSVCDTKQKSIILLWIGGNHYEIIGKLLPGNKVCREFDFNEPLIQTIHTFLENPNKIPKQYPNLIPYLPKSLRENIGVDISDSEEEREKNLIEGSQKENESSNSYCDFSDSNS